MAETFSTTYRLEQATATPAPQSFDLFPTRIWQVRLDALEPRFVEWESWVLALRAASPNSAGRSNRGGWNSREMDVLERPVWALLRQATDAACAAALGEMGRGNRPFQLQSWVNLHDRGGFNFLHMHEASLLSGSFYLEVPAGSGALCFRDPRAGVLHGSVKGSVPNGHADVRLKPSAGLLVLFPSWLEHYVEPHESDEPRICIAFNANA
ncbi:MAG TPA: 2OG-Fe(II) oxygenase family protein [Steroidobacteraceae bacterium]|nr:2OG-Fe(II) oxygenase family protein [Steroidobacteraceae bacterium]